MIRTPAACRSRRSATTSVPPSIALAVTAFRAPHRTRHRGDPHAGSFSRTRPPAASAFNLAPPSVMRSCGARSRNFRARDLPIERSPRGARAAEQGEVVASPASQSQGPAPPDAARGGARRGSSRLRWALGVVVVPRRRRRSLGARRRLGTVQATLAISSASPTPARSSTSTAPPSSVSDAAWPRVRSRQVVPRWARRPSCRRRPAPRADRAGHGRGISGAPGQRAKTLAIVLRQAFRTWTGRSCGFVVPGPLRSRAGPRSRASPGRGRSAVGCDQGRDKSACNRGSSPWPSTPKSPVDGASDIEAGLTESRPTKGRGPGKRVAPSNVVRRSWGRVLSTRSATNRLPTRARARDRRSLTPAALVLGLMRPIYGPPKEEQRRAAPKTSERVSLMLGRAYLADMAGTLWTDLAEESDRAGVSRGDRRRSASLRAWTTPRDDPRLDRGLPNLRLGFPYDPAFLNHASSGLSDDLELRHDTRLAYCCFPNFLRVLYLGRALASGARGRGARSAVTQPIAPRLRGSP